MDTGSSEIVTYNKSYVDGISGVYDVCLGLNIDSTIAELASESPNQCIDYNTNVMIGTALANVEVVSSTSIGIQNDVLHQWINNTDGVIGLSYNQSYCKDTCGYTSFQKILLNSTYPIQSNLTFGLDLRNPRSSISSIASTNSTLQLGGVKEEYEDSLVWLSQPQNSDTLYYHLTYIKNLEFLCTLYLLYY